MNRMAMAPIYLLRCTMVYSPVVGPVERGASRQRHSIVGPSGASCVRGLRHRDHSVEWSSVVASESDQGLCGDSTQASERSDAKDRFFVLQTGGSVTADILANAISPAEAGRIIGV